MSENGTGQATRIKIESVHLIDSLGLFSGEERSCETFSSQSAAIKENRDKVR
jgi:hypothetical protein